MELRNQKNGIQETCGVFLLLVRQQRRRIVTVLHSPMVFRRAAMLLTHASPMDLHLSRPSFPSYCFRDREQDYLMIDLANMEEESMATLIGCYQQLGSRAIAGEITTSIALAPYDCRGREGRPWIRAAPETSIV
jgi:hypothetical protein